MIKVGSDFSGVGAFNQSLMRLGIDYKEVFACDMDKYARQTFIHNYGEPGYYPINVYDREIPSKSLDIYMTSPPCQAFSVAGKRLGKADKRGILFFNSHEFIQVNKPRFFIFENVKGLLSDSTGTTFQEWINYLGGKSVNGVPVLFPTDEAVPYHIYWKVLNAKNYNIPQNRERVFIVGIRDDADNVFSWPKELHLTKRLKDVLEDEVDEKYFMSEKMVSCLINNQEKTGFKVDIKNEYDSANCITTNEAKMGTRFNYIKSIGNTNPSGNGMNGNVFDENGVSPTLTTNKGEGIKVKTCIPVLTPDRAEKRQNGRRMKENGDSSFTLTAQDRHGVYDGFRIRRLTPRECFRLMDFPDSFTWPVSDSQAYKQAGNSICVGVLSGIINQLKTL